MNNKTLLAVGGCAVLLLVCCVVSAVLVVVLDVPGQINSALGQQLEQTQGALQTAVPTVAGVATQVAPPPPAPTVPGQNVPTQPPPGPISAGNLFADAVNKSKSATKYRVEFAWVFGGMEQGKYQETSFFDMSGEVDGANSHFVSKGGLLAMLATDKNANIEFIEADGKSYMKGVSLFGMTDPKVWYITDESSSSSFKDFAKPDDFRNYAGGKDSDFKKTRSESLDGKSCDVWVYDFKSLQNAAIIGALGSAQDKNAFSAIDKAEVGVWLCNDGYSHKWTMDYQGHDAKNPNDKGALKMTAHMWDFNNSALVVTAPKDAKPMPK